MKIKLSPMRLDRTLTLRTRGDTLFLNEDEIDFSSLPEGATLPKEAISSDWFAADIERVNGELQLCLILPHGADAPKETLFPDVLQILEDGPVTLPLYENKPVENDESYLDDIEEGS